MMAKYRKKPVVIEAVQYLKGTNELSKSAETIPTHTEIDASRCV